MEYRVTETSEQTIAAPAKRPFNMRATKDKLPDSQQHTALLEATLYKEDGAFVKQCTYLFEALDAANLPLTYVDINEFKNAVDLYCTGVLHTEYYVKSIPRASSLCGKEMQAFDY
jgi:hypothetical protein